MEIGNLNIINIQDIYGNMTTDQPEENVFSQIFTDMLGQIDMEDSSEDLELLDLSEEIPDQEEDHQEDIIFNPMNVPWLSNNNLQPLNLNIDSLESNHDYAISAKGAQDINKDLSLVNEDLLVEVEESLVTLDKSKTAYMDKEIKLENPEEKSLESSLLKSEAKPVEKENNLKDSQLSPVSRDNEIKLRNNDEIDLYKTQIHASTEKKVMPNEFNNVLNSQLIKLESIDLDDNIQSINDALIKLVDLKANDGDNTIKVKLYPEELGYVDITLRMEEGKLVAKILVENEQVMELFNKNMDQLNDKLIRQDISLDKLEIDLNLDTSSHSNSSKNQEANKNLFTNNRDIQLIETLETIELNETYINGRKGLSILA